MVNIALLTPETMPKRPPPTVPELLLTRYMEPSKRRTVGPSKNKKRKSQKAQRRARKANR